MPIKLVLIDGDGTISNVANPYFVIARRLGCEPNSRKLVRDYHRKKITYKELVAREDKLFLEYGKKYAEKFGHKRLTRNFIFNLIREEFNDLAVYEDVNPTCSALRARGIPTALLSSGLDVIIELLAKRAGIEHWCANSLRFNDEMFTGREIRVEGDKILAMHQFIQDFSADQSSVAYIGNDEFDFPAMKNILKHGGFAFAIQRNPENFKIAFPKGVILIDSLKEILKFLD